MKKKILVTGATGFVGNYVVNELLGKGFEVVASSSNREKAMSFDWFNSVKYIPVDLRSLSDETDCYSLFGRPDMLIHLAWEGLPNYKSSFHIEENLPRHYFFLKNLIRHGLKDVSVTGTCFEYGMREGCLSEEMPSVPSNCYAIAKNKLRLQLNELMPAQPFNLKWIRLFYMYGRGQSPSSLLSQLQSAIDRGDTVFNMSPGDQLRDYLPVEKVAENIVQIAIQNNQVGIINCCSGNPIELKRLVGDYLKKRGAEIRLNLGYYPYADYEPKNFWGNNEKLKILLSGNTF